MIFFCLFRVDDTIQFLSTNIGTATFGFFYQRQEMKVAAHLR